MSKSLKVLDASALLAWVLNEPGGQFVEQSLEADCVVSAVNLIEFASKLIDLNYAESASIAEMLKSLGIMILPMDESLAMDAALLREVSRKQGLSLGDRACLALAQKLNAEVLTADKAWLKLGLNLSIIDIRAA
jgi:hypothetical protein